MPHDSGLGDMEPRDARFARRDSAFSMQLPIEVDGPTRPIPICDRFFILSNSRTIEIVTADSIDKERKNPALPHTNRVVFEYGLKDEFIKRSLVQFSVLAGKTHLPRTSKRYQSLVWDLTLILGRIEVIYQSSKSELLKLENEVDQWIASARGPAICAPIPQSKLLLGNMKSVILETNEIANKVEQFLRSEIESGILKQQPKKMSFFDFFSKSERRTIATVERHERACNEAWTIF